MSLLTSVFAQGTHAAKPAAAAGNTGYYYFETDTTTLWQSTGSAWVQIASVSGGGGGSLTSLSNQLGADVTCTTLGTYYNGPGVTLSAGTWLVTATLTLHKPAAAAAWIARLWDGTTTYASTESNHASGFVATAALSWIIVVASGTPTISASAASSNTSGGFIRAATPDAGVGNNASSIVAVKIA